ncbi:MAG TPA: ABC transporter ATP-binding protein [Sphingomonadaceae bacterium]|nr:ABC transporter ATP-binding protein [Sphingomonadaceae bacterium]
MRKPGLQARGVALGRRLAATDLDLAAGSLTVLVGPNGAGKTSLLHALARIGGPAGEVRVEGRSIDDISPAARPKSLGYVPAARELAWPLSVRDFVRLTATKGDAAEVLSGLKLDRLADRRVDTLSTGERTRVLLARALLPAPAVLLLDEPFANLDPLWQLRLVERLQDEAKGGMTVLVSVHDFDLAVRLARRMLVMDEGRLVADGRPDALFANGTIENVFGVARADRGGWTEAR